MPLAGKDATCRHGYIIPPSSPWHGQIAIAQDCSAAVPLDHIWLFQTTICHHLRKAWRVCHEGVTREGRGREGGSIISGPIAQLPEH